MLKIAHTETRRVTCMLCGRPAQQSICLSCTARVQGQAIELKRQAEGKGRPEPARR